MNAPEDQIPEEVLTGEDLFEGQTTEPWSDDQIVREMVRLEKAYIGCLDLQRAYPTSKPVERLATELSERLATLAALDPGGA